MEKGESLVHLKIDYKNKKGIEIISNSRSIKPIEGSTVFITVMDNGQQVTFLYDVNEKRGYVR